MNRVYLRLMNISESEIYEAYRAYEEEMILDIARSTIQFFKKGEKRKYEPFGSGVLVEISSRHFVFSAAHVIDDELNDVWVLVSDNQFFRLGGEYRMNFHSDRENDDVDYGIIILNDSTVIQLKKDYKFISEQEIGIDQDFGNGHRCIAFGFPVSKTKINPVKKSMVITPFKYISRFAPLARYKGMSCDPNHRVLVHYEKKGVFNLETKNWQIGPNSHGMSGCGLWILPSEGFSQDIGKKKLVGILTDWYQQGFWAGTKIDVFTEYLRHFWQVEFPASKTLEIEFGSDEE